MIAAVAGALDVTLLDLTLAVAETLQTPASAPARGTARGTASVLALAA
ncbi:hypothetical protein [Janibacter anophelis]